jgi:hypothetical protein
MLKSGLISMRKRNHGQFELVEVKLLPAGQTPLVNDVRVSRYGDQGYDVEPAMNRRVIQITVPTILSPQLYE